jgi:hypothetical protein
LEVEEGWRLLDLHPMAKKKKKKEIHVLELHAWLLDRRVGAAVQVLVLVWLHAYLRTYIHSRTDVPLLYACMPSDPLRRLVVTCRI